MNASLFKLVIITSFGRNSARPLGTAVTRLLLATITSLTFGILLAKSLWSVALPKDLPLAWILLTVSTVTFSVSLFVLTAAGMSSNLREKSSVLSRIQSLWPLKKITQWGISISAKAVILGIMLCFGLPISFALAHALQVAFSMLITSLIFGAVAAFATISAGFPQSIIGRIVGYVVLIGLLFRLLELSIQHVNIQWMFAAFLISNGILQLGCLIAGFWQGYRITGTTRKELNARIYVQVPSYRLPKAWFAIKTIRNTRTLTSLIFCSVTAIAVAVMLDVRHIAIGSSGIGWLLFSALLIGAFASDIRGISRRHRVPEIEMLKGTESFVLHEFASTLAFALLLSLPIYLVVLVANPEMWVYISALNFALLFTASAGGLLAGSVFVPGQDDIGSQFFSAILATSILLVIPKLLHLSSRGRLGEIAGWVFIGSICALSVQVIEKNRRSKYGHA